jgi:hypothetical protein
MVMGGFSNEADKVVAASNSQFKSKFFRLSKYSQSRKAAGVSKHEDAKFEQIEEGNNRSVSESSKQGDMEGESNSGENNDLVPRKTRWDRKSKAHNREEKPAG